MKELEQKYIDILEENDWIVSSYTDDGRIELEKYSMTGEDFIMCVEVENFSESVREYADNFDVNEHIEIWTKARRINGVPQNIIELVDNALTIQEMLKELADALEEEKNSSNTDDLEKLKHYKENSYYIVEDIAEKLIELSNLQSSNKLIAELENALHWLKCAAQNKYNNDYFRVFYNVLLVITGMEVF